MSSVNVSDFRLTRFPAFPSVHVSEFRLTLTPQGVGPAQVHVSHFSLSLGLESPITGGATWARLNGSWSKRRPRIRSNGEWR
jgi:hypothetical protein